MNVLIIEDEQLAAEGLADLLQEVVPGACIAGVTASVAETKSWLLSHATPDLALVDIHLADGSSIDDLLPQLQAFPVIFTTAYDAHALQAFASGSIAYLLKPIRKEALAAALEKLHMLRKTPTGVAGAKAAKADPAGYRKRFMIRYGENIRALLVADIAYCYSENKATYARTFDNRNYLLDLNMDALEATLDPEHFFRINRQYIVCLKAIAEMKTYSKGRVLLTMQPATGAALMVSVERAPAFKKWLDDAPAGW